MTIRVSAREALVIAVKELMSERPINDISVKEIIHKAGVSMATFYKYFTDKFDLVHKVFEQEIVQPSWYDTTRGQYERHIECLVYLQENRAFYLNAIKSLDFMELWQQSAFEASRKYLGPLLQKGQVAEDVSTAFCHFTANGLVGDTIAWLKDPCGRTPRQVAEELCLFIDFGLSGVIEHRQPLYTVRGSRP